MAETVSSRRLEDVQKLEEQGQILLEAVGLHLKRVREEAGLSLRDVESRIGTGVSRAFLSKIENGQGNPTWGVLCRISEALDVPFAACVFDAWLGQCEADGVTPGTQRKIAAFAEAIAKLSAVSATQIESQATSSKN